jgi:hypothetical protein
MVDKMDSELEKRVFEVLPLVARFVKNDMKLTENQFKPLAKFHREAFEWARNSTVEEINAFLLEHKDSRIFHDHIEALLSPKGRVFANYLSMNWPRNGNLRLILPDLTGSCHSKSTMIHFFLFPVGRHDY